MLWRTSAKKSKKKTDELFERNKRTKRKCSNFQKVTIFSKNGK